MMTNFTDADMRPSPWVNEHFSRWIYLMKHLFIIRKIEMAPAVNITAHGRQEHIYFA